MQVANFLNTIEILMHERFQVWMHSLLFFDKCKLVSNTEAILQEK